jgi:hypothetical protein
VGIQGPPLSSGGGSTSSSFAKPQAASSLTSDSSDWTDDVLSAF